MVESVVSDVVGRIVGYLDGEYKKEMVDYFGGIDLNEVRETLRKIRVQLPNAERRSEEGRGDVRKWLKHVKHVLYQMEGLLEEVVAIKKEKSQHLSNLEKANKGKLRLCLNEWTSKSSNFTLIKKVSKQLEDLMRKLQDEVISRMYDLAMAPSSFVPDEEDFVGRDEDKDAVLKMLLDDSSSNITNLKVIWIEGLVGVGKTTLARVIYNEENVKKKFDVRGWANMLGCPFSMQEVSRRILPSLTYKDPNENVKECKNSLQDAICGKTFLFVLDNFQDQSKEDRERWIKYLKDDILHGGKIGSKLIITSNNTLEGETHSGLVQPYTLSFLSKSNGWILFKRALQREGGVEDDSYWESNQEFILAQTSCLPLAIRFMAAAIYSCKFTYMEQNWESFKFNFSHHVLHQPFGRIKPRFSTLVSRLDPMPPQLKWCLAYLLLFPKNYEFNQVDVIYMWKAHGVLKTLNDDDDDDGDGETLNELGVSYWKIIMSEILGRQIPGANTSFLVDVKKNEQGELISCKISDEASLVTRALWVNESAHLMVVATNNEKPNEKSILIDNLHHVSFVDVESTWEPPSWLYDTKALRSLFIFPKQSTLIKIPNLRELFRSLTCLRVLVLGNIEHNVLSNSIKELKHLRYLKIGGHLETLPYSITRLQYLQILDLAACQMLQKIPTSSFGDNLNKVRILYGGEHKFVVDEEKGLHEQASSNMVVENIVIYFKKRRGKAASEFKSVGLSNMKMKNLALEWSSWYEEPEQDTENKEDELLTNLQPPPNLHSLKVYSWKGVNFPMKVTYNYLNPIWLPKNLVSLHIEGCSRCRHLPSLSQLPFLKYLYLLNLKALEYIEEYDVNIVSNSHIPIYFPSLEDLKLEELLNLKAWSNQGNQETWHPLSHLYMLKIFHCPTLKSIPKVPKLESLSVKNIHQDILQPLQEITTTIFTKDETSQTLSPSSIPSILKELHIVSVHFLSSLSINQSSLQSLTIKRCHELNNLRINSSTFRKLHIFFCGILREISGTFKQLEELKIWSCPNLTLWDREMHNDHKVDNNSKRNGINDSATLLPNLQNTTGLKFLTIGDIMRLKSLPTNLDCFIMLQKLTIYQLGNLKTLLVRLDHLISLRFLEINNCSKLRDMCVTSTFETTSNKGVHQSSLALMIEQCPELIEFKVETLTTMSSFEIRHCNRIKYISGVELVVQELVMKNCSDLHLWHDDYKGNNKIVSNIKSLNNLTLQNILKLESLSRGLGYMTTIVSLNLSKLRSLKKLPEWIGHLTQLCQLHIVDCPSIMTLIDASNKLLDPYLINLPSLSIEITRCQNLLNLFQDVQASFKCLKVYECEKLKGLSKKNGLVIQELVIFACEELQLWKDEADEATQEAWQGLKSLHLLTLEGILKPKSISKGVSSLEKLEKLSILKLHNLEMLLLTNAHLTQLEVTDCSKLESISIIPALTHVGEETLESVTLDIQQCPELVNLSMKSLLVDDLRIYTCGHLRVISNEKSKIEELDIEDCDELELWKDQEDDKKSSNYWQTFNGLQCLSLDKIFKLKSLPKGLCQVTTLEELNIFNLRNLQFLPNEIDRLSNLREIYIENCPLLTCLPSSISQLESLDELVIVECSMELENKCQPPDGEEWLKIRKIPFTYITSMHLSLRILI